MTDEPKFEIKLTPEIIKAAEEFFDKNPELAAQLRLVVLKEFFKDTPEFDKTKRHKPEPRFKIRDPEPKRFIIKKGPGES